MKKPAAPLADPDADMHAMLAGCEDSDNDGTPFQDPTFPAMSEAELYSEWLQYRDLNVSYRVPYMSWNQPLDCVYHCVVL
mgnify:CR=1 FL=1